MDLSYPVGKFVRPAAPSYSETQALIDQIETAPAKLRATVAGLSEEQLDTPYRPGGWTPRQVVHHVFDSHVNSYIRMKLALTEDNPVIKPYDQDRWAVLADNQEPVEVSLLLVEGLHRRWVVLLRSLGEPELALTFRHPELGSVRLDQNIALYAWHGRHHVGHITGLRDRMGWGT
ncbi:MAG TPA: putative metal-dependent hydrolase [Bryobacteraceae bacterium]|nr:putative metal-dependent hydrolase [Bryobacteraceae bacterium]